MADFAKRIDTSQDPEAVAYRAALENARRPTDVDERVVAAMRTERQRSTSTDARAPRHDLSRRRFVALGAGAAAIAGISILGVGLPLLQGGGASKTGTQPGDPDGPGDTDPSGRGPSATDAAGAAGTSLFGLAVANAAEVAAGTKTFELAPTAEGLVPVATYGTLTLLKLNFATMGEGLYYTTYVIDETPAGEMPYPRYYASGPDKLYTDATYFHGHWPVSYDETRTRYTTEYYRAYPQEADQLKRMLDEAGAPSAAYDQALSAVTSVEQSFTANPSSRQTTSTDTDFESGGSRLLGIRIPKADFWARDEILDLYGAWLLDAGIGYAIEPGISQNAHQTLKKYASGDAYDKFRAALDELTADPERTYVWARTCYQTSLRLATETLAQTTIRVGANYQDNRHERRYYRIMAVDGFDDAVGDRFDALFAHYGYQVLPEGIAHASGRLLTFDPTMLMQLWNIMDGEPIGDLSDPRLQAPLFTITDVTDEVMADG